MPEVTYTGGGHYRVAGVGFDPGDTQDVNDDLAEYLDERNDFEIVSETDETGGDAPDEDTSEPESEDVDEESGFDAEAFLDRDAADIVDAVEAGEADGHLDEVGDATEYVTVEDAVGERRAELEG
ncbi:hypothetical protein [Halobacterium sp. CBA1126]|uniref:hypothetical protein n=1 Tax=Halobacterium sp. CBA1126 TaxID=2668074 RepID=UPI0012FC4ED8|nr:hypothetical protein [Halobacterium sp. CBA1126]MUV59983.1 hypothetical protein [Halobacterium sp. CBA1126]